MKQLRSIPFGTAHLLCGLVLLVALLRVGDARFISHTTETAIVWLALLGAFTYVTVWAGPLSDLIWTYYIYFCVVACVLTLGLWPTLMMIVLGSGLAVVWLYRLNPDSVYQELSWGQTLYEFSSRVAISGISVIIGHSVYGMLGGETPFTHIDQLSSILIALAANAVILLVMLLVGVLIVGKNVTFYGRALRRNGLVDFALQMSGILIPVALTNVSLWAMMILLALILFQATRVQQIRQARDLLARRARDVSTLGTLSQAVSSSLSLDDVLAAVHEQLYTLLEPTIVMSALYDDASDVIEVPAVMSVRGDQKAHKYKPGRGLSDWVIRNRKPLQLNLLETASFDQLGIDIAQVSVQAYVGVPLIVGDKLIGVLSVGHDLDPNAFNEVDVTVLQTIATQAALAIRNASLYNRSVRLANNLAIINQSLQQVMFNLDRESLVRTACSIACQVMDAERAAVYIVQERLGMRLMGQKGMDGVFPEDYYLAYRADAYHDGSRAITNVEESPDRDLHAMARQIGFRACLEVPLRSSNTVVGMIVVYHDEPHIYQMADISLLEMLANQVAAAFDNTDLLHSLELYASEQAQLLYLSRIASSNLDLERVILDLGTTLGQMVNMQRVDVAIFRTTDEMDMYYSPNGEHVERRLLSIHHLPELQIVLENPQLANPYVLYRDDESVSDATRAYMETNGMALLTLMPMSVNRQVFGLLLLSSSEPMVIVENTRRLMEMAIYQVSAQIHNARLYTITEEALSQQLEQLSLIEEIAQKISQSLNVNAVAENLLDAVLRAMPAEYAEILLQGSDQCWQVFCQKQHGTIVRTDPPESDIAPDILEIMRQPNRPMDIVTSSEGVSVACVPLLSGERALGVLRVVSEHEDAFRQEEINFIRSLAGHAAISIDNAFLLEERQFQVNALTSLRELSLEVVGNMDGTEVTRFILRTAMTMLEGSDVSLYSHDSRTDELVPMMGLRRVGDTYETVEPHIIPQPIYKAVTSRQVVVEHLTLATEVDQQANVLYPTIVAVPIVRHGQIGEVLVIGFENEHQIQPHDFNTIDLLAVQVASHLETITLNQTIRDSNNRMRAILDSTRDGIILLDNFGRVQDANRRANDLLGTDLSLATGDLFVRYMQQHVPNSLAILDHLLPSTDHVDETRDIEVMGDSGLTHLQVMALPVRDANGDNLGRLLSLRDITDEKQLATLRESLQRMVIHDLRSPMGAIITGLSFIPVLMEDRDPLVEQNIRRTVEASLESASNLMRLMDTLSDIPRMKDIQLSQQPISIRMLANKAYESLETLFLEAGITFTMQLDHEGEVLVDIDLMRRVFINLLHNALKFTPENGTILVATDSHSHSDFMRVLVCDTGPGIPADMRERIFGEFQQIQNQLPKRGGRGTGLGLTLCKLVVEAHGGYIRVEEKGHLSGACFALTLPLDHGTGQPA